MQSNFEEVIKNCEDLEYLNKFEPYLRETEYRLLLYVAGHTKHGKVPLNELADRLTEYWFNYGLPSHVKNTLFILNRAVQKINYQQVSDMFKDMALDTKCTYSK